MGVELSMEEEGVQCAIAQTTKNPEVLESLADSPYASVRKLVAHNPAASDELLTKLSADNDAGVKVTASMKVIERQRSRKAHAQKVQTMDYSKDEEAKRRLEALRKKYGR